MRSAPWGEFVAKPRNKATLAAVRARIEGEIREREEEAERKASHLTILTKQSWTTEDEIMNAHKDWCSCEDCVRDTPDDRHLTCRAENKLLQERLRAAEDRAQQLATERERWVDCHAGPGTTEPACGACTTCLTRELDAAHAALADAQCGDCCGRGREAGRVGGTGRADCATCGGTGYITFTRLATAEQEREAARTELAAAKAAYDALAQDWRRSASGSTSS